MMKLLSLISLVPFIASVSSSAILEPRIPAGSPNGIYVFQASTGGEGGWNVTKLADFQLKSGNASHTSSDPAPIGPSYLPRRHAAKKLSKRAYWGETGHTIASAKDLKEVATQWTDFFLSGNEVGKRSITVFHQNDAQIAACNYKHYDGSGVVHWWLVDDFNGVMDDNYGQLSTGWVHYDGPFDWSYWRDVPGTVYCTNLYGN